MGDFSTATLASPPHIGPSQPLEDSAGEFLGIIACDAWEEGRFGLQLHFGVKPVDMVLKGATGMFSSWYKPTDRKASKMGALLLSIKACGDLGDDELGFGKYVGKVAWFDRITLEFGEIEGKKAVAEGVLVVKRVASADEKARAASGGGPAPAIAAPEYTDEQLNILLDIYNGKTAIEAKKFSSRGSYAPEIKNAVLSGTALTVLQERGLAAVEDDGKVMALALATTAA